MPVSSRLIAPASGNREMSRYHALGGVSFIAIQIASLIVVGAAHGQSGQPAALPPVNVEAPREAKPRSAAQRPRNQTAAARRQARPPGSTPAAATAQNVAITLSAARDSFNQAPNGQTATTIDRSQFDNR